MSSSYTRIIEIPQRGMQNFRHFFIPHEGNDHRPLVIRPTALKVYSIALILVKVLLTGFLYSVYPTEGRFAELTAARVFELTNASRSENGVPQLTLNPRLSAAAAAKANDLVKRNYFDHTSPDGKKFWQWITEANYSYVTAGENLAMDFTTAESAHTALLASASHRKNILKGSYTEVGLAVVEGMLNDRQTTVLVELFGAPAATQVAVAQKPTAQPIAKPASPPPATSAPAQPQPGKQEAPAPVYAAVLVGTSDEQYALLPGSTAIVWVDFKNTGNTSWNNGGDHFVALNVTDPAGRASPFHDPTWVETYRPALLAQDRVSPGEIGRFAFSLTAPQTPGEYTERFGAVAENLAWVDGAHVTLPITVVAPAVATAPAKDEQQEIRRVFTTTAVEVQQTVAGPSIVPDQNGEVAGAVAKSLIPDWQRLAIDWSSRFFWAFLIFLTVALTLNILVRFRIQHRHVILQTLAVIALSAGLLVVKLHFVERIAKILVT